MPASKSTILTSKTFKARILSDPDGSAMTAIEVPFDPKPVFGKVRAPVVVTVGKHTFRSTIASMGGCWLVPLRKSNREAAGVEPGQTVPVTLQLDEAPRTVEAPADLKKALRAAGMLVAWEAMSFTHQREYVQAVLEAKKPETRERRIAHCVEAMKERTAKSGAKSRAAGAKKKPATRK